ncbi:MAG: ribbon-helix-helix domain-containing protein [Haloarculaceae archaeon]
MKPTTIRLPEDLLDRLDEEAREHEFANRTEYLRYIIDNRELVISTALERRADRVRSLAERVETLEVRLDDLEADAEPRTGLDSAPEGASTDEAAGTTDDAAAADESPATDDQLDLPDVASTSSEVVVDEADREPLDLRDPGPEEIRDRVSRLEFFAPTRVIRREREAAVAAAWRELVDRGQLSRDAFESDVFAEHTASFSTFAGWYDRLLEPALEQLEDVERADAETWEYVG